MAKKHKLSEAPIQLQTTRKLLSNFFGNARVYFVCCARLQIKLILLFAFLA